MGYFRELPNLLYPSYQSDKNSSLNYIEVKNLFRRVKLRDDLQNVLTLFNKYEVPEGSRPELIAEEVYGDPELDWVVLITAGIINVRDDWPLSDRDLYKQEVCSDPEIEPTICRFRSFEDFLDNEDALETIHPTAEMLERFRPQEEPESSEEPSG